MTPPSRPRRARPGPASAAVLLALVLLSSGLGTAARWSDDAPLEIRAVTTGALALTLDPAPQVLLRRTDLAPGATRTTDLVTTTTPVTDPRQLSELVPGDTVVVATRASLDVEGTNLTATLTVDPGLPNGGAVVPEVRVLAPGNAPVPAAGQSSWPVSPADDGATYDVTVTYRVPSQLPAGSQDAVIGGSPLTLTLAQN